MTTNTTTFDKKQYMKIYNTSAKAKQAQKNWYHTPEGKAKFKAAQRKYQFKYAGVYAAKDIQTGDYLYVGGSKSVTGRIINHKYAVKNLSKAKVHRPTQYELYENLSKHQVDWTIICQCDPDKVKSLEKYYISLHQPPYNKNSKNNKNSKK
jgi:excinuclease UvrABC nuclease subunit